MPDLGPYHPFVVHLAIGFLIAGVVLRWISFTGRAPFASAAALSLLLAGTLAAALAVKSGDDAHGPVERVPGSAEIVHEHEEWGERARNVFVVVCLAELVALALARRGKARPALLTSSALCFVGLVCLYQAGTKGGDLVYSYAGGVGIRTGDPKDVERLLVAAVYHQTLADRKAGKPADAVALLTELSRRHPDDPRIQLLVAESALVDLKNPEAALAQLGRIAVPADDARTRLRHGVLTADAHEAAGRPEAARATLQQLVSTFPQNARIRQRLEAMPR